MKNVLITGAAGFIGQQLAARLLNDASAQYRVILTDIVAPPVPRHGGTPDQADSIRADLRDPESLGGLIAASQPLAAVFVFHGIMSSGSEADPDLSFAVNLDSTRALLMALATTNPGVRVIYASSQAVYGPPLPPVVTDSTTPTPASVYGTHKLMSELLINDLHRRGLLDAFSLRFPSISVRAGKPTQAASSFLSGIIREPLNGQECVIPLKDRSYRAVLCSPSTLMENLVKVMHLPSDSLPAHIRGMNVPGISATIQEMMDALESFGGKEALALLREEPDPDTERILRSWALDVDCSIALKLGLVQDESVQNLVGEYWEKLQRQAKDK
ncbi:nucleoside-diphosphate-sugar epimerase [Coniochaeta ligniaria NRRL 30616]|uniref:Nucleoside-diphosphate-sugar epimerase n=1 Tax=Coniochaeta ligniaria NRRL 30616 TaxID=1408157 RepID=A0A1J7IQ57_9PEZI|nr:nucleoside-diphosphate-sugar epimerase [Coniochaeta ligniaria NRRL 30616]